MAKVFPTNQCAVSAFSEAAPCIWTVRCSAADGVPSCHCRQAALGRQCLVRVYYITVYVPVTALQMCQQPLS